MEINSKNSQKATNIAKTDKTENKKTNWLNKLMPSDSFVKSKISDDKKTDVYQQTNDFQRKNDTQWGNRFNSTDTLIFRELCVKGLIDINIVDKFATNKNNEFDLTSISNVYVMGKDKKDENFADKVIKSFEKCGKDNVPNGFTQSIFEPDNEYKIAVHNKGDKKLKSNYYFDANTEEVIGKSSSKVTQKINDKCLLYETKAEDFRNNTKSTKVEYAIIEENGAYKDSVKSETIEHYSKDGKITRTDIMDESEIKGVHNIRYEYPDGRKQDVVKASVDAKTGIKTIKKDMQSSDGTRTEFLYEDDPQGNRIVDYKITDTDGKVIMKNSQTFEVVDDNHFVSTSKGHTYNITADDKGLKVKDVMHSGKETSIEFKNKVKGNKEEIISLLKKVPGDELFEVVDCVKKVKGNGAGQLLDSAYNKLTKNIGMSDNLFVFLHELGHAKDAEYQGFFDIFTDKNHAFQDNANIQNTYLKERQEFNKHFPQEQREHVEYFTQAKGHYGGQWGGLQEVIAETNAIGTTYTNSDVKCLSTRSQYLQQHFPKTIAAIQEAMYYKNDIEALKYYGT